MNDLAGKTAFVTGGASGIGLAMGRAFAEAGMRVMLADIEPKPLQQALEALQGNLPEVESLDGHVRRAAIPSRIGLVPGSGLRQGDLPSLKQEHTRWLSHRRPRLFRYR